MNLERQKQYEETLIGFIEKYKICRWSHIDWQYLGFSRSTAYEYDLDKLDTIKGKLEENRQSVVNYLLQKWIKSDNATLQIAAMRIVAEEEDRQRLNQQYIDHTSKNEKIDNRFEIEIISNQNEVSPEETN